MRNLSIKIMMFLLVVFISATLFLCVDLLFSDPPEIMAGSGDTVAGSPDVIVYADYYAWFNSDTWKRGYSNTPLLGFYNSLDSNVLAEHSRLANTYGIDVFRVEYIPQMDNVIRKGILNTDLGNTRICLMYDVMVRNIFAGKGSPPYNFDDPAIYSSFVDDLDKIADKYFSHPNYFNINGRPVIWIYITRELNGNWMQAIGQVRENMIKKGFNPYIIGDHVYYDYDYSGIKLFDAVGIYSPYQAGPPNPPDLIRRMEALYSRWSSTAVSRGVDFIPGAMPGYNDMCLAGERAPMPPFSCSAVEFKSMLLMVSKYLDCVNGAQNLSQVSIATFNENQEGSGIEPSIEWGYDRISVVPEVFGSN